MRLFFIVIIMVLLSPPKYCFGSDIAVLYLSKGHYISSDSSYIIYNLDGSIFDVLTSRNGNEPTFTRVNPKSVVAYYPDLMIYAFFCIKSSNNKTLIRIGDSWKILYHTTPFSILRDEDYFRNLWIRISKGDRLYKNRNCYILAQKDMDCKIYSVKGDFVSIKIGSIKYWFRWKIKYTVIPDRLLYE